MAEAIFGWKQSGIDAGTKENAAVGEHYYTAVFFCTQLVEERGNAGIEVRISLATSGPEMHVVVIPHLEGIILYLVVTLHLPIAHVHLL